LHLGASGGDHLCEPEAPTVDEPGMWHEPASYSQSEYIRLGGRDFSGAVGSSALNKRLLTGDVR